MTTRQCEVISYMCHIANRVRYIYNTRCGHFLRISQLTSRESNERNADLKLLSTAHHYKPNVISAEHILNIFSGGSRFCSGVANIVTIFGSHRGAGIWMGE